MKKQLLITSFRYPPENYPRAFRTGELVEEFLRRGYEIDLFIPDVVDFDVYKEERAVNYYLIESNRKSVKDIHNNDRISSLQSVKKSLRAVLSKSFRYIFGSNINEVQYGFRLYKELKKNIYNKQYDMIISIGLPFYVHLATSLYINKYKQIGTKICDYGDPFYYNPAFKKMFFLKVLENWVIKHFDYISIPTAKSINYYTPYKQENRIKVIPQGFNFNKEYNNSYKKNDITTFGYAGVFYKTIRNPDFLFEFLSSLNLDFRFIIFTRLSDPFVQELIQKYNSKLGEKLIVNNFIPRDNLINEMIKMDFLINLENEKSNQVPSKVIDYTLSKRPILSINKDNFNENEFLDFLNGKYDKAIKIKIEDYDIKNVVNQFEQLL
ncbi:MAG TPA: glycosyltransferase family 4 protein [Bacteroidales bacterium]|nr:glycosyltransferase family 4 protein [Bacteroidales bacterium]